MRTETAAACYMTAVAGFYSLIPVTAYIAGAGGSPFLFNSAWRIGLIAGISLFISLYILKRHRPVLDLYLDNRRAVARSLKDPLFLLSTINALDYALLSLSLRYVNPAAASALFELWPICFILLRAKLEQRPVSRRTLALLLPAATGMLLVTLSQMNGDDDRTGAGRTILGAALAFSGGLCSAQAALSFRWAAKLKESMPPDQGTPRRDRRTAGILFPVLLSFAAANIAAAPLSLAAGLIAGEAGRTATTLGAGFGGGLFLQASGAILYRAANVMSSNLGINAIYYLTPCLTLLWLQASGLKPAGNLETLLPGIALIAGSNLLISRTQK